MVVAAVVAAMQVPVPAGSAAAAEAPPVRVPALPSTPAPVPAPALAVGDFADPPLPPSQRSSAPPTTRSSFDARRSTPLDTQTTPTRRLFANADGSTTAVISAAPVRERTPGGVWRDLDLSLAAEADGTLHARFAPKAARFGGRVGPGAETARVETAAGPVVLRHPDAASTAAVVSGSTARFPTALSANRELTVRATTAGFETAVVLASSAAPAWWREQLVLPAAVSARQGPGGVELVDAAGAVVARYDHGVAFDAAVARTGPQSTTPARVRLVSQAGAVVTIEVAADPAWASSPARVAPITIDPTFKVLPANDDDAIDTWVYSGESADTSFASHTWLLVGSADGGAHRTRSLLRFDTAGLPTGSNVTVLESHLSLFERYSYAGSCAPRPVEVAGSAAAFSPATTWNTQPGVDAAGVVSTTSFAHHDAPGSACPEAAQNLDATTLARRWLTDSAPNLGMVVRAQSEVDPLSYKGFYSAEGAPARTRYPAYRSPTTARPTRRAA